MPRTKRSQFPQHLIDWYWNHVEERLVTVHAVDRDDAKVGIQRFRDALAEFGVCDMQYHAGHEETADDIKAAGYLP